MRCLRVSSSNLQSRLLTAGLAIPVLLGLIFVAPAWAWFVCVLFASLMAADELLRMTHGPQALRRAPVLAATVALQLVLYLWGQDPRVVTSALLALPVLGLALPLLSPNPVPTAALRSAAAVLAPLYSSLLLCLALMRRDFEHTGSGYVLLTLTIAWMADTGGYFAGRAFGKRPLYAAVSPKKTREGAVGGVLASMAAGLVAHFWYLPELPLIPALALSLGGSLLSQLGDLGESLIKRAADVKDSGALLPGHGGILDRIDGLLFAAPLVYLYLLWQ